MDDGSPVSDPWDETGALRRPDALADGGQDASTDANGLPVPPPPAPKRSIGFSVLRGGAVLVVVFSGLIWGYWNSADRGDDGSINRAGDLDTLSLQLGDCFDTPDALADADETEMQEIEAVRAVPCSDPHDEEIFFVFELDDGPTVPGRATIDEALGSQCLPAFDEFVGMPYEDSQLDISWLEPTAESWKQGDRVVTCTVYDLSGEKLVGSARGAAR